MINHLKQIKGENMKIKLVTTLFLIMSGLIFISCSVREENNFSGDDIAAPIVPGDLKITSPVYRETWQPGTKHTIKWNFPEEVQNVKIYLYRKSEFKSYLTISTPNTGSFEWEIPSDIRRSVHYRLKIQSYDHENISTYSEYFFIVDDSGTTSNF